MPVSLSLSQYLYSKVKKTFSHVLAVSNEVIYLWERSFGKIDAHMKAKRQGMTFWKISKWWRIDKVGDFDASHRLIFSFLSSHISHLSATSRALISLICDNSFIRSNTISRTCLSLVQSRHQSTRFDSIRFDTRYTYHHTFGPFSHSLVSCIASHESLSSSTTSVHT